MLLEVWMIVSYPVYNPVRIACESKISELITPSATGGLVKILKGLNLNRRSAELIAMGETQGCMTMIGKQPRSG